LKVGRNTIPYLNISRVMLTCALKAQVKELKIEIKNKFFIKNITFSTFEALNVQFSRKKLLHLAS
jgi:hypothetical protein